MSHIATDPDHRADAMPKIYLLGGDLSGAVKQAASAIYDAIYVRSDQMVRLSGTLGAPLDGLAAPAGDQISIRPVDTEWLRVCLANRARFVKHDARTRDGERQVDPPRDLASALIATADGFGFRPLRGVVRAPLVRLDGSLVDKRGYDPRTGLYFDFADELARTEKWHPSRKDAERAAGFLADLLRNFPFTDDTDRAVALSAILTAIQRPVLPSAPMHAFDSPTPGTGKTKLTATVSAIAMGTRASVMSVGAHPEETNKRLDGAVLLGTPVLVLDNIEAPLGGDKLCSLLSEPWISIRPLGGSAILNVPTNTTVLATGNNLRLKGDVTRRSLIARLDAAMERPEQRSFDQDVVAEAFAKRRSLVAAALTIIRAYHQAGCPNIVKPLGSFEDWTRMVRAPLVWAGCSDPVTTMERLREDDPALSDLKALVTSWYALIGSECVTVADVIRRAEGDRGALYEAIEAVAGEKTIINRRRLGRYLRRYVDRIVCGLHIVAAGDRRGSALWRIVDAGN